VVLRDVRMMVPPCPEAARAMPHGCVRIRERRDVDVGRLYD
jgi:hypothetical protein